MRGFLLLPALLTKDIISFHLPISSKYKVEKINRSMLKVQTKETEFEIMFSNGRELGSQELRKLPRQDKKPIIIPPKSHVCAISISETPTVPDLKKALEKLKESHPLLQCVVKGNGEKSRKNPSLPRPYSFVFPNDYNVKEVPLRVIRSSNLDVSWKNAFRMLLDNGISVNNEVEEKLLWSVQLHVAEFSTSETSTNTCVILFQFNQAITDQKSVQVLVDHFLRLLDAIENNKLSLPIIPKIYQDLPLSLEKSLLHFDETYEKKGIKTMFKQETLFYLLKRGFQAIYNPVVTPDYVQGFPKKGRSILNFKSFSSADMKLLAQQCNVNNVTLTNALIAAMVLTSSKYIPNDYKSSKKRSYKTLQSLDMRLFENIQDPCITPSFRAGSLDIIHSYVQDYSQIRNQKDLSYFWELAKEGQKQTNNFVKDKEGPYQFIKVSDFFTKVNNLKDDSILSPKYSCGVENVPKYESLYSIPINNSFQNQDASKLKFYQALKPTQFRKDSFRTLLKATHGRYTLQDIYFASSSAALYQLSACTVNNELKMTFHSPDTLQHQNDLFADDYVNLLKFIATNGEQDLQQEKVPSKSAPLSISSSTTLFGLAINIPFLPDWIDFVDNLLVLKENSDFWPILKFWGLFTVGHAILQPILSLSEILHGSPGFLIGDLVPIGFVSLSAAFLVFLTVSKQFRDSFTVLAISSFFAYIGAGLDGQRLSTSDYNIAFQDPYRYKMVKGCPSYDDIRQPSMNTFDIKKYEGKWYEQKFHDWTQFKENYDTTINIKLSTDSKIRIDDYSLKGPSISVAKRSWEKSPLTNGVHYNIFSRIDEKDPPGMFHTSYLFGIEFPNYIVDVKKDTKTGEYAEAIQFQCLEREGIRVYEGINFFSRSPQLSKEELKDMHARAKKAGLYPYGASEDQMHFIERKEDNDLTPIDNAWQRVWSGLGFDTLMNEITKSIKLDIK